jgi:aminoglycoside phosphotransferase (APT) family kinase protein
MTAEARPAAEVTVDVDLVRALLTEQHPDLAALPLRPLASGWDNAMFRLGGALTVRLPRRQAAADLIEHERRWLPSLASSLPLPVPVPVRVGRAALGYPWSWSVCPWLPGAVAADAPPSDPIETATRLGAFLAALHRPAPADAPRNPFRGIRLAERDARLRDSLARLGDAVDAERLLAEWQVLSATPPWHRAPVWLHGDLHPVNILVADGRVSAIIDFGDITGGDPATDLAFAWSMLPAHARLTFRRAAGDIDDDTWQRARAWALAFGVAYVARSADDPRMTRVGHATLAAVLSDRS